MTLTPEQQQAVSGWVTAGDNLSAIQKKLSEQFQVSMTYREVRFLVDDLNLALKDPAPKVDTSDVSKTTQSATPKPAPVPERTAKKGILDKAKEKLGLGKEAPSPDTELEPLDDEGDEGFEDLPAAGVNVRVDVDKVTLIPGAVASGSVTFSDGVTGKWIIDQQGRPGFTEVSQPGYRPSPEDGQAFMKELSRTLQQRGY
ncbi:MAG: hypothetical protein ABIV50_15015 [Opitutus sp.]